MANNLLTFFVLYLISLGFLLTIGGNFNSDLYYVIAVSVVLAVSAMIIGFTIAIIFHWIFKFTNDTVVWSAMLFGIFVACTSHELVWRFLPKALETV